jgi:tripartite-type tricarboxylate transporter receptor subunit TctC
MRHRIAALVAALAACTLAFAQEYPSRSVKVIVPYAPGGQPDVAVRVLAQHFASQLGQPFVVENIPGASGLSAINAFLKMPGDGYTLSHSDGGNWAINVALNPKLAYDPQKDFAPVGLYGQTTGLFLATTAAVPVSSLQELVALAKAKPGALSYASAGVGSIHHLIMEDFKAALGLNILHVPYKGSGQAVPALVGGQVSMSIASLAVLTPYAKEGRVRILSVSTGKRSSLAPEIPTMAEAAGIANFDHGGALGIVSRAGTPRPVIDRLSALIAKAVAQPDVIARFATVGLEPVPDTSPEALRTQMTQDLIKYKRVVAVSGVTAE